MTRRRPSRATLIAEAALRRLHLSGKYRRILGRSIRVEWRGLSSRPVGMIRIGTARLYLVGPLGVFVEARS